MDPTRQFSMSEIVGLGLLSGVTVSIVKLIQWNFHLDNVSWTQIAAAGLTLVCYMTLGAVGAAILVDHDARGQKMLKQAFLMGFVAPSVFLALLNNPASIRPNFDRMIERVPRISEFLIGTAYADERRDDTQKGLKLEGAWAKYRLLDKSEVDPSFTTALANAFGWGTLPASYTYVIGTTADLQKANLTAKFAGEILRDGGAKDVSVFVIQPKGMVGYFVAVGGIGTPYKADYFANIAKGTAFNRLQHIKSEEGKKAAALLLSGEVLDARAMFRSKKTYE